jgi:hypothetical protein
MLGAIIPFLFEQLQDPLVALLPQLFGAWPDSADDAVDPSIMKTVALFGGIQRNISLLLALGCLVQCDYRSIAAGGEPCRI